MTAATPPGSDLDTVRRAKETLRELLAGDHRVAGVGIAPTADGGYRLKVGLVENPGDDRPVPTEVDGVPVFTEVVGTVHPL